MPFELQDVRDLYTAYCANFTRVEADPKFRTSLSELLLSLWSNHLQFPCKGIHSVHKPAFYKSVGIFRQEMASLLADNLNIPTLGCDNTLSGVFTQYITMSSQLSTRCNSDSEWVYWNSGLAHTELLRLVDKITSNKEEAEYIKAVAILFGRKI